MSDAAIVPRSLADVAARGKDQQPLGDGPPKIQSDRLNFFYGETQALADISVAIHSNMSRRSSDRPAAGRARSCGR